jgi:hypothetical protein
MKKLILISAIALSGVFYNSASAQIRVHLGVNFGTPEVYVPSRVVVATPAPVEYNEPASYDGDDDYYYLPDVDAYYNVNDQCYFYNNGGAWVSAAYLPGAYRDYDWRSVRHYEVRASRPYLRNDFYRARFNGAVFNGQWNRGYDRYNHRGYVNSYRDNDQRFRNDNRRFYEGNRGRFNRSDEHFSRDNFHGHEGYGRGEFGHRRS